MPNMAKVMNGNRENTRYSCIGCIQNIYIYIKRQRTERDVEKKKLKNKKKNRFLLKSNHYIIINLEPKQWDFKGEEEGCFNFPFLSKMIDILTIRCKQDIHFDMCCLPRCLQAG
jgi:hypothetical protein